MGSKSFGRVWYRDSEFRFPEMLVYRDMGELELRDGTLHFAGDKSSTLIARATSVSYGHVGQWIVPWVKVDFRDGDIERSAYFAVPSLLGWGGVLGGTRRMYDDIRAGLGL